jgi:hypothetical protein
MNDIDRNGIRQLCEGDAFTPNTRPGYNDRQPCRTEREFFAAIKHAYVEPEARI